jgi:hypothetical protein
MSGKELLIALGRTKKPVKILAEDGSPVATLPADQVLSIVRDAHYRGHGTKHRVKAIQKCRPREREVELKPWGKCLHGKAMPGCGECAGCLRASLTPSVEWSRKVIGRPTPIVQALPPKTGKMTAMEAVKRIRERRKARGENP